MKHLFTSEEVARLLQAKGYDEPSFGYWERGTLVYTGVPVHNTNTFWSITSKAPDVVTAPMYQQVVDWFREKHQLYISVTVHEVRGNNTVFSYEILIEQEGEFNNDMCVAEKPYKKYHLALDEAIAAAIKLLP